MTILPFQAIKPVCAGCRWPIHLYTKVVVWPTVPSDAVATAEGQHAFRCPVVTAARAGALPAWEEENGSTIVWQLAEGFEVRERSKS